MNGTQTPDVDDLLERANRLYWESAARVDDVAGELGISRNALYAAVRPLPAGVVCAGCGEPAHFANRSRRRADEATCLACGVVTQVDEASPAAPASAAEAAPESAG
ncbi:MAG: hypothetical protein M3409_10030, partial [Gemmatimonadota bacterium]|nr:hypothetical protein [Gemmatimonadota bacterium]